MLRAESYRKIRSTSYRVIEKQ